eukprot:553506-Prymnesium_polylepis.1
MDSNRRARAGARAGYSHSQAHPGSRPAVSRGRRRAFDGARSAARSVACAWRRAAERRKQNESGEGIGRTRLQQFAFERLELL